MTHDEPDESIPAAAATVEELADLARLLRRLRRRQARQRGVAELTYREIAARTGISISRVGVYLTGSVLPPTDRFDVLARALGAAATELGPLATARDRLADDAADRGRASQAVIPRMLPSAIRVFIGRLDALDWLDALLAEPATSETNGPVVISAVAGMGVSGSPKRECDTIFIFAFG